VSLATGAFGTFDNLHLARTFASAQEAAIQDLVSQLPESKLAREARSRRSASKPMPTGPEDSSSGAEQPPRDGPPEKPQEGNPATERTPPQSSTPTVEGPMKLAQEGPFPPQRDTGCEQRAWRRCRERSLFAHPPRFARHARKGGRSQ
jgi:hypothetical protein